MDKHLDQLSDEDLMNLVLQKNHPAFAALVTRHASHFYGLAYRSLFDKVTAEDIVQEAFLKLWQQPEKWNANKQVKFTTWFYRITLNLCLDVNKRKKSQPLTDEHDLPDSNVDLERTLSQQQKQRAVDHAIAQLPEAQRTALNLCFYDKRSNQEAADIMNLHIKALQSLLIRAKSTLKNQLTRLWNVTADE